MRSVVRRLRAALTKEGTVGERRQARVWSAEEDPQHILLIRLHAIGDTVALLPIAAGLRQRYPKARIGAVVGNRAAAVATTSRWFDDVQVLDLSDSWSRNQLAAIELGLAQRGRWEVVLDLQRNDLSRILRRTIAPQAFGEMERFSARHGLERTLSAVGDAGIVAEPQLVPHVRPELAELARAQLRAESAGSDLFVLLNPAGLFATRRWPKERWVEFARRFPREATYVVTGLERVRELAESLRAATDIRVIDLVGRSDLAAGLAVVAACDLAISEDGAFLHAAWCGGIPTVALLGSTRSDWVRPLGAHSRFRGSQDLPCGDCMAPICARGDVHCLTRIEVDEVIALALEVLP